MIGAFLAVRSKPAFDGILDSLRQVLLGIGGQRSPAIGSEEMLGQCFAGLIVGVTGFGHGAGLILVPVAERGNWNRERLPVAAIVDAIHAQLELGIAPVVLGHPAANLLAKGVERGLLAVGEDCLGHLKSPLLPLK